MALVLTKVAETGNTITLGWTPPSGVSGYVLYANGQVASVATKNLKNGSPRNRAEFSKSDPGPPFEVAAVCRSSSGQHTLEVGVYPTQQPQPPAGGPSISYLRWRGAGFPPSHTADYRHIMIDEPGSVSGNPASVLRYFDAMAVLGNDRRFPVTESMARANGWLLKDSAGNEIRSSLFGFIYADVGNSGYISEWGNEAVRRLNAEGMDGCFVDDAVRSWMPQNAVGYTVATSESKMVAFIRGVSAILRAAGKYVIYNAGGYTGGDARSDTGELDYVYWRKICDGAPASQLPSALLQEYYMWNQVKADNNGGFGIRLRGDDAWWNHWDDWDFWHRSAQKDLPVDICGMADAEALGYRGYAFASWLLTWTGSRGHFISCAYDSDPWMKPPGVPLEEMHVNGNRIERQYTDGLVWVDPTNGAWQIPGYGSGPQRQPRSILRSLRLAKIPEPPQEYVSSYWRAQG